MGLTSGLELASKIIYNAMKGQKSGNIIVQQYTYTVVHSHIVNTTYPYSSSIFNRYNVCVHVCSNPNPMDPCRHEVNF